MNDLATIDSYCELTKTELTFKREVSKDEWQKVFDSLNHIEGCVQFWIGDCLKYREQRWGMYDDVIESTGYDKNTIRHIKNTADSIESGRRRPELGYSHHVEVSSLEPKIQDEILQKAVDNRLTVRETRAEVKKIKDGDRFKRNPKMPNDVYNVIYADPPWQYNNSGFTMSAENKYPTMSIEQLKDLSFKTSENAVLFLWVTNPLLFESVELVESWGFEYKTNIVWIKKNHTAGFYVYGQHELLLICVKGSGMLPLEKYKSIIQCDNKIHSKKPEIVYDMIEKMYPNQKYLELFARNTRDGWESYGNEI